MPPPTPGPRRVPVVALAAVILVGLIVIGALVATRNSGNSDAATPDESAAVTTQSTVSRSTTSDATVPQTSGPITSTPTEPVELSTAAMTARASSVLPPDEDYGTTYGAENLLDGDLQTAWSQAGSVGGQASVGSWVAFDLSEATHITGVSIINGYVKSDTAYLHNDRPRDILISTDGGQEKRVTLADVHTPQDIAVDFPNASTITITIESVYLGNKWHDVAMTEVRFAGPVTG